MCSGHCCASRPVGEASLLTRLLRHQTWRATGVMKGMPVMTLITNSPAATWRLWPPVCLLAWLHEVVRAHVVRGTRNACAVGVCSSRTQCKDDEASDKTDLRHEHADTPKLKSVPECLRKKC